MHRSKRGFMVFEIYKDNKGYWRWRGKTEGGEVFAESGDGYKEKSVCVKELELFKKAKRSDIKIYADKDGIHRWTFQKPNGEAIADSSDGFYDKAIIEEVVNAIVKDAPQAEVVNIDSI
jgi:uncharacterized protein YegP (UPF0339 family)